jgi:sterol desaturase/sphingolipid hydroxylase (fatty acid hydroxylase superfamily)
MFDITASNIRLLLFFGGLLFFLIFELLVPYRSSSVSKLKRWMNNLGMTLFNSILINLVFSAAVVNTAIYAQSKQVGILNILEIPTWFKILITIAFMDLIIYIWHLLNHEMPFLWRFHRVHHSDLNMDVSTATRFHVIELAISAVIKISIIFFLGAGSLGVIIFESTLVLCAQFTLKPSFGFCSSLLPCTGYIIPSSLKNETPIMGPSFHSGIGFWGPSLQG